MTDQRSKVNSDGTENPIFLPTGAFAPARRKRRRVRVKCTVNFRAPCSVISVRPAPRDLAPRPCKILRPAPVTVASAADIFPPTAPARTFNRHRCPHNRLRLLTHCPRAPYPACFCDRFRIAAPSAPIPCLYSYLQIRAYLILARFSALPTAPAPPLRTVSGIPTAAPVMRVTPCPAAPHVFAPAVRVLLRSPPLLPVPHLAPPHGRLYSSSPLPLHFFVHRCRTVRNFAKNS